MEANFRFLRPDEGAVLSEAIRVAYGETYDVRWVYDEEEVEARLAAGTYVSCVAESPEGELLCHEGMSLAAAGDAVGHSGQAVTMPAARGQHLFTRTKRYLMDWAQEQGLAGMYSEATAAHPYSQRANIELGANETGFLLGWIPATGLQRRRGRRRSARRQSAALFYTKLNDGHERPVYAPPRHHGIIGRTLELCELRGDARRSAGRRRAARADRAPRRDRRGPQSRPDHGPENRRRTWRRSSPPSATTSSTAPGLDADLPRPPAGDPGHGPGRRPARAPRRLLRRRLPQQPRRWRRPAHAVAPPRADERRDLAVASDHGRELLEYVLGDLPVSA